MSNFLEEVETIRTFHNFLGVVLSQVEKGEKVNFKSISKLSNVINDYYEECTKESEKDGQSPKTELTENESEIKDKFLRDILTGNYEVTKVRKSIIDYNSFRKNTFIY